MGAKPSGGKLVIDGVRHAFDSTPALDPTSLWVRDGEFVSIVGPSGCGKSTLFNIVSGLLVPTEGRVLIDGRDVTGSTGHVGYMLQKDLLVPWRTVEGNILMGPALTRGVRDEDRVEARELAERYGLGEFIHHFPHALSGGMRQRVALMRTLAFHRDVLLLDEPFGALDAQTRFSMQQWLLGVWADLGRTIVFVTHDVDEAVFLADRVAVMSPRPGRIAATIPVAISRPRTLGSLTGSDFVAAKRAILDLLYAGGPPGAARPREAPTP